MAALSEDQNQDQDQDQNQDQNQKHDYVFQTMLTCIGNKRKLIGGIRTVVDEVCDLLKKDKLNIVDGFSGSSVVSRELTYVSNTLWSNDAELYSYLMSKCYLVVPKTEHIEKIHMHIQTMNELAENGPYQEGIICKLYAPSDTEEIKEGERCFYTRENALIIDTLRAYIETNVESEIVPYCLVPLLNKASIHTNTAGVFKGFYKGDNNIGCFGGKAKCALSRIKKPIRLECPVWNTQNAYTAHPSNKDINVLVEELPNTIDLMYLDPPYNQHPYGSNYFMLNVIATNEEPKQISKVSGIPKDWNKSKYNSRTSAIESMQHLLENALKKASYLILSYNNEGIIKSADWDVLFSKYCVKKYETVYDTYKGSRNLKERSDKVVEIMYLLSKK